MRNSLLKFTIPVFLISLFFPLRVEAGPETKSYFLKFGTMAPQESAWTEIPKQVLVPLIHEMWGDRLKLTIYYGGAMGDDDDIIRKINLGQLQGCCCTNQGTVKAVPELSVFSLPLLFQSYEEVDYVVRKLRGRLQQLYEDRGLYPLFFIDTGFLYYFSREDPSSMEKIRSHRVFSWFGEIQNDTFNALGISPIPVAITELSSSISTGLTNGGAGPASWLLATQMYPYINYVLDPPLFYGPSTGFIDKKSMDKITADLEKHPEEFAKFQKSFSEFKNTVEANAFLDRQNVKNDLSRAAGKKIIGWLKNQRFEKPSDVQALLFGVFREAEPVWVQSVRGFEADCFNGFFQRGMKKVKLQEKDFQELQNPSRKIWQQFSGQKYPERLLSEILNSLSEFRGGNNPGFTN
ncbi:MAG: TRAP transporter substrate-binding protein DctP [Proteobacteria bacterium]|nr:TRAP transporter substrate-binding protein DctP [Pseudomonadota bacterium]